MLGLIAILPNALPALVLFGVLGWTGYEIDLSIAIMACVGLGIVVDELMTYALPAQADNRRIRCTGVGHRCTKAIFESRFGVPHRQQLGRSRNPVGWSNRPQLRVIDWRRFRATYTPSVSAN